jgi:hypothetical protein
MKKLIMTVALVLVMMPAAHADTHPQMFKWYLDQAKKYDATEYFECNYTSRTCEHGYRWGSLTYQRVFDMVDDQDRSKVIGHGACMWSATHWGCWNFTTGTYVEEVGDGRRLEGTLGADHYDQPLKYTNSVQVKGVGGVSCLAHPERCSTSDGPIARPPRDSVPD